MSHEVFVTNHLKELSDGDLALELETMADMMEDNRAYKDQVLPPCITGPIRLREHAVSLKHASAAAKQDESKEGERLLARENGIQGITFARQYVVMFSVHEKDPTLLESLRPATRPRNFTKAPLREPEAPSGFVVKHTGNSGEIYVSVNSWKGKGSVELQICEGDPAEEASWRTLNIFHGCRMRANGLDPAKRCYFRARIRNDVGTGPWSEIVELIIL